MLREATRVEGRGKVGARATRQKSSRDFASAAVRGKSPVSGRTSWRAHLLAYALIAFIGFGIYIGSRHNSFVWDDEFQIARNPYVHGDLAWQRLFTTDVWGYAHAAGEGASNYYRPLQMLTYRLVARAENLDPSAFHWVSVVTNVLAGWAAYALLFLLCRQYGVSLSASLLFAVHPMHSEAVLWISALNDLGCALFYFIAFCFFLLTWRRWDPGRHLERHSMGVRARATLLRTQALLLSISGAAFFVSLLWKEMALSFPFLIVTYAIVNTASMPWKERAKRIVAYSLPFVALTAVYVAIRIAVLGRFAAVQHALVLTPFEYAMSAIKLVGEYWLKLLLPLGLNAYHTFVPARTLLEAGALISILFIAAAVAFIFKGMRVWPIACFAAAWVFFTLVPVLNLRGVGENVLTERYLYIPSLGFCLLVVWCGAQGLGRMPKKIARVAAIVGMTGLVTVCGIEAQARTAVWENDYSLFSATAQASPESATMHNGLGHVLREQRHDQDGAEREYQLGYAAAAAEIPPDKEQMSHALVGLAGVAYSRHDPARSLDFVEKALAMDPQNGDAHVARGVDMLALGRLDEAQQVFEQALRYAPNDEVATNGLGLIALSRRQIPEAIAYFSRTIKISPGYGDGYNNLGRAYFEAGQIGDALPFFERALELAPDDARFHTNYGIALARVGKLQEGRLELERALALDPEQAWARQSLKALSQMESQHPIAKGR
jgi:Tfp pilus assembly protein PilF